MFYKFLTKHRIHVERACAELNLQASFFTNEQSDGEIMSVMLLNESNDKPDGDDLIQFGRIVEFGVCKEMMDKIFDPDLNPKFKTTLP